MTKQVISAAKWTRDDVRLLVVFLLVLVYPMFVLSFFALYVFVLLPGWVPSTYGSHQAHQEGWYHYYWLVLALLWVLLCGVILPCFWDEKKSHQSIRMETSGTPEYPTKPEAMQPFLHVEEGHDGKSGSLKSKNSSASIEKEICEEKVEKESLERSRESLQGSSSSLEKKKLTQSGEFLSEFIDTLDSEERKKKVDCEVHAEEDEKTGENESDDADDAKKAMEDEEKEKLLKESSEKQGLSSSSDDSSGSEVDEPLLRPEKKTKKLLEATQGEIEEAETATESPEKLENMDDEAPQMRQKARPTIDTSRASEYYECSMPTPKSAEAKRPESNVVFLFVNPESAATQEDVILEHTGEVEDHDSAKDK